MNEIKQGREDPPVRVQGLTKRFGFTMALDGVGMNVGQGEILAVFGPNGAGKTTFIQILSTLMRPTSGTVHFLGYDILEQGERVRGAIGVLPHNPLLFPHLTAYENLKFYGQMFGVKNLKIRIEELLENVGLAGRRDHLAGTFSRGMQQRLAIARAMIHDPRILLLDEPCTGLDRNGIAFLGRVLTASCQTSKTVIMTSHDFAWALEFATKAAILNSGHLVYFGAPSGLKEDFETFYQRCLDREG